MKEKLYRTLIELTNSAKISLILKKFATSHLSKKIIPSFAKVFKINLAELSRPLNEYYSLHHFFIRDLRNGARVICAGNSSVSSPVDASLESAGVVDENKAFIVKGQKYFIAEMVGDSVVSNKYLSGYYMLFYLSPRDYHRIHAPVTGSVTYKKVLGKKSYPVNELGMRLGKKPLSKNFRLVTEICHKTGHVAMIKVGALNINTIERTHMSDHLVKGEEVGYFSFGSTVVLLFEKGTFTPNLKLTLPCSVKMGEKIGDLKKEEIS